MVSEVLRQVLLDLSKLMAPFTPFIAEMIYQKVKNEKGKSSVHLEDWIRPIKGLGVKDKELLRDMALARKIVELGHRVRKEQNIKVRQPLSQLQIVKQSRLSWSKELLAIIADELNIKKAIAVNSLPKDANWVFSDDKKIKIAVYIAISPELRQEGLAREIIRAINGLRKELNLTPNDIVSAVLDTDDAELKNVLETWGKEISAKCRFKKIKLQKIEKTDSVRAFKIENTELKIKIS